MEAKMTNGRENNKQKRKQQIEEKTASRRENNKQNIK